MTSSRRCILLVDDEPDILESFRMVMDLRLPQAQVLTALSGREALEILARHRANLILSDYKMPGMDGIEFLVQARRLQPDAQRVLYTAFSDETLRQRATREAGVRAFLSKSLALDDLVAGVETLLHASVEAQAGRVPEPAG